MRRLLVLAAISSLTLTGINPAIAATKAGATCTKLNSTAKSGSTTLKCTKVGKKLIWQALPQPTPLPTQTPSAFNSGEPEATKAFNSIRAALAASPKASANLVYYVSPTITSSRVEWLKQNLQGAIDLWGPQYIQTKPLPTFFLTEKDKEWMNSAMITAGIPDRTRIDMQARFDGQIASSGDLLKWAGVYGRGSMGADNFNFYAWGTKEKGQGGQWVQVGPHEWTHNAQNNAAGDLPCWFREGQATYYGIALSATTEEQFFKYRKDVFGDTLTIDVSQEPAGGWSAWIDSRSTPEADSYCGPDGSYNVGGIITEYMVSLKGHQGILDFYAATRSKPWLQALESTYGMPWTVFKTSAINHLMKVAKFIRK